MAYGMAYGYPFLAGKGGGAVSPFIDAAAAYSLRNLGLGASNVVRVRRSSDNTEQDFTAAQITGGGLLAFCGSGDGFVSTWYDQSGNARNATQATALNQPKIVDNGAVILENGKASIQFDGVNSSLISLGFGQLPERIVFTTMKSIGDGDGYENYWIFQESVASGNFMQLYSSLTTSNLILNCKNFSLTINGVAVNTQSLVTSAKTLLGTTLRQNGVTIGTKTGVQNLEDVLSIGKFTVNYAFYNLQELIVFNDDKTAEITEIETNINGFYNIY